MCPSTPVQRLHALTASKVDLAPLPASPPPPRPGPPRPRRHFTGRGGPRCSPLHCPRTPCPQPGWVPAPPHLAPGTKLGRAGGALAAPFPASTSQEEPGPPSPARGPPGLGRGPGCPRLGSLRDAIAGPGGGPALCPPPLPPPPPHHPNMDLKPQAGVCPPDPCQVEGGCTGWGGGPPSWQGPELGWGPPHTLPGPPYVVGSQGGG